MAQHMLQGRVAVGSIPRRADMRAEIMGSGIGTGARSSICGRADLSVSGVVVSARADAEKIWRGILGAVSARACSPDFSG